MFFFTFTGCFCVVFFSVVFSVGFCVVLFLPASSDYTLESNRAGSNAGDHAVLTGFYVLCRGVSTGDTRYRVAR
jgi:hypothetical protein